VIGSLLILPTKTKCRPNDVSRVRNVVCVDVEMRLSYIYISLRVYVHRLLYTRSPARNTYSLKIALRRFYSLTRI